MVVDNGKKCAIGDQTQFGAPRRAKIRLRANGGRRKTIERSGVLEEIYPSVFIVKLDEEQHAFKRVSYSYADILTESVEVTVDTMMVKSESPIFNNSKFNLHLTSMDH